MRATLVGLVALFVSGPSLAQDMAGDPEVGHELAGMMCQTCHGLDGSKGGPSTPRIGGQPATYLAAQLRAFRSGERENEVMNAMAKNLKDEQIEDMAAWYASHTGTPVLPEGYSTAAAPEECFGCHGADGIARGQDVPNLAGQNWMYLYSQLEAFHSGERESEVMTAIAQRLSNEELVEVAKWYASVGLDVSVP